jgi:hypothetical protein
LSELRGGKWRQQSTGTCQHVGEFFILKSRGLTICCMENPHLLLRFTFHDRNIAIRLTILRSEVERRFDQDSFPPTWMAIPTPFMAYARHKAGKGGAAVSIAYATTCSEAPITISC